MHTVRRLWRLARPGGAVWVVLLAILGYGWAHWDRSLGARNVEAIPWLVMAWLLLHAGTLWLNAALDKDEGEVLWGGSGEVPSSAAAAGYVALIGAVGLGFIAAPTVGLCALGCALLAVAYSHPRLAWKAHPVLGPAVNAAGYGVLSPLAGWSLVQVGPTARTLVSWPLLVCWVLGCYFLAQAFQEREDAARGYRTLVATAGPRSAVRAARFLCGATAVGVAALAIVGWYPRVALGALPVWWWADRWMATASQPDGAWTARAFRRLLGFGWALLLLVLAHHLVELRRGGPTAGLATAAGWPADRAWVRAIKLQHLGEAE